MINLQHLLLPVLPPLIELFRFLQDRLQAPLPSPVARFAVKRDGWSPIFHLDPMARGGGGTVIYGVKPIYSTGGKK
jgi:hypothetical protein